MICCRCSPQHPWRSLPGSAWHAPQVWIFHCTAGRGGWYTWAHATVLCVTAYRGEVQYHSARPRQAIANPCADRNRRVAGQPGFPHVHIPSRASHSCTMAMALADLAAATREVAAEGSSAASASAAGSNADGVGGEPLDNRGRASSASSQRSDARHVTPVRTANGSHGHVHVSGGSSGHGHHSGGRGGSANRRDSSHGHSSHGHHSGHRGHNGRHQHTHHDKALTAAEAALSPRTLEVRVRCTVVRCRVRSQCLITACAVTLPCGLCLAR